MLRPYDLLENVLEDIEKGIREGINSDILAEKYALSERHLRKLFKFAFKQSLGGYIRSRKLAASLDDLLKTDMNLLDIALEYGFDYEQSYINAFKREFGVTPGNFRKLGHIIKVKPPLQLFDENKFPNGLLFGPDIVMVPQFHYAGKFHRVPFSSEDTFAAELGKNFWFNERRQITSTLNPAVYIGISKNRNFEEQCTEYIPAVQVPDIKNVPKEFYTGTFEASLCAKFRYIRQLHYSEINRNIAGAMYEAISKFTQSEHSKYSLLKDRVYFERIDTSLYDGPYCQMEWITPVLEK